MSEEDVLEYTKINTDRVKEREREYWLGLRFYCLCSNILLLFYCCISARKTNKYVVTVVVVVFWLCC